MTDAPNHQPMNRLTHTTIVTRTVIHSDNSLAKAMTNSAATVLAAAAWPLAVVIVVIVLKSELTSMLSRIKSFKAFGMEASLDSQIQANLPPVPPDEVGSYIQEQGSITSTSTPIASNVIMSAWTPVEKALEKVTLGPSTSSSPPSIRSMINALSQRPGVPTGLMQRVTELFRIRNRLNAGSDGSISEDSLRLYRENAYRAERELIAVAKSSYTN